MPGNKSGRRTAADTEGRAGTKIRWRAAVSVSAKEEAIDVSPNLVNRRFTGENAKKNGGGYGRMCIFPEKCLKN